MRTIGLDIGGANIKAADNDGVALSRAFALWRSPELLAGELRAVLAGFGPAVRLAVTMTGELCDCFATKAEGVAFILDAVAEAADGVPVFVWQTGAEFVSPEVARETPQLVAAANWHALATFCGRLSPRGNSLLIDVGSTTTDIIPLVNGFPVPNGMTDLERLQSGELVYTGVRRTPVCAVVREVTFRDSPCRPAAELFATMLDVYLLLGRIPEDPSDCDTANGKPATIIHAEDRLARMLCCDRTELSGDEIRSIAAQIAESQRRQIVEGNDRVLEEARLLRDEAPPEEIHASSLSGNIEKKPGLLVEQVILSGSGEFLAREVVAAHPALAGAAGLSLPDVLSPQVAAAACAFAVARLGAERL